VPWAAKLGSIARTIFIIDLFAGAGTYKDARTGEKHDGSPVIFARLAQRYAKDHPGKELRVICVERNRKNADALSERVAGFGDIVTVLVGASSRHLAKICATIGNAPALILFDPIGLKPIAAETIKPLLHRKGKTDVFMVLHFKVIHRTAGMLLRTGHADPNIPGAIRAAAMLDAVFDAVRWRMIAKNPRLRTIEERERAYLDLYFEEVLESRYEWCCAYAVRGRFGAKVQYWLVHASNHLDAHLLMNDEIVKLEERLYAKTYEEADERLLEGFATEEFKAQIAHDEERLKKRVLEAVAAAGGTMSFGHLRDLLLPEFFGRVKQGAYSRACKALVKEGRLEREASLRAKIELSEHLSLPRRRAASGVTAA
jgi:three-Cys-motif partner protein